MRALLNRSLSLVERALVQQKADIVKTGAQLFAFDPEWKSTSSGGRQFTQKGIDALFDMFSAGLSNSQIAKLMQVKPNAIWTLRKAFESGDWGRLKPTQLTAKNHIIG
jgi:hypothetical protein